MRLLLLTLAVMVGPLLETGSGGEKPCVVSNRHTFVCYLRYTTAKKAVRQLEIMWLMKFQNETDPKSHLRLAIPEFPATVTADTRTNALRILTSDDREASIRRMVTILDWRLGLETEMSRIFGNAQSDWKIASTEQRRMMEKCDESPPRKSAAVNKEQEAAEIRVLRILQQPASWRFRRVPLQKAIHDIAGKHGLDVVLDSDGLKDAELIPGSEVNLSANNVPLWSALLQLLRPIKLGVTIEGDKLKITSLRRLNSGYSLRIYPVADIVATFEHGEARIDYQEVVAEITTYVPWSTGRVARDSIRPIVPEMYLAIWQTEIGHKEIEIVLSMIRHNRHAVSSFDYMRFPR